MQVYEYSQLGREELAAVVARPRIDFASIMQTVAPIVEDVRLRGDEAVRDYTRRFDGVELDVVCTPIEVGRRARREGRAWVSVWVGGKGGIRRRACRLHFGVVGPGSVTATEQARRRFLRPRLRSSTLQGTPSTVASPQAAPHKPLPSPTHPQCNATR